MKSMNSHLESLSPSLIWKHFRTLCDTPRPSYHEARLREHLIEWADGLGLSSYVDTAGNLIIRKAATSGMEDRETVVLQGHLDMVAQKNANVSHDFVNDPIKTRIVDGWVYATDTTLGADNGIGVAAALAVLESTDIAHGPIEALFTIEEETSLRGAAELEEGILNGKILLNLDSEDRGDVYIGCAGGTDINVEKTFNLTPVASSRVVFTLSVEGLKGGHSGLDIHKGRASANVLLVRTLAELDEQYDIQLVSLNGGTLRNAIAREAMAQIAVTKEEELSIYRFIQAQQAILQAEFGQVESELKLVTELSEADKGMSKEDQRQLIRALRCAPHGVARMSAELEGVTETSCNLGVIRFDGGQGKVDAVGEFSACLLVRSLVDTATLNLAKIAKDNFLQIDADVRIQNGYPGWRPDPTAGLLKHFLEVHKQLMGYEANVKVIHAGLECGIIGAKYPRMEMVSFGPNIRGAHSPTERLEIDSVADFWNLLVELLKSVPMKS